MIKGNVTLDTVAVPISGATLTVRVQDVSRADASSEVTAQVMLRSVSVAPGRHRTIPFQIDAPPMDPNTRHVLWAHLDVNDSGDISAGDYITMESVPVDERLAAGHVDVPVRAVS